MSSLMWMIVLFAAAGLFLIGSLWVMTVYFYWSGGRIGGKAKKHRQNE